VRAAVAEIWHVSWNSRNIPNKDNKVKDEEKRVRSTSASLENTRLQSAHRCSRCSMVRVMERGYREKMPAMTRGLAPLDRRKAATPCSLVSRLRRTPGCRRRALLRSTPRRLRFCRSTGFSVADTAFCLSVGICGGNCVAWQSPLVGSQGGVRGMMGRRDEERCRLQRALTPNTKVMFC